MYRLGETSLNEAGFSSAQYHVLMSLLFNEWLGNHDGMNPSEISSQQGTGRNTVSALIRSLEEDGLIERRLDERDRRRFNIGLTDTGRQRVRQQANGYMRFADDIFTAFTPEEMETFSALLKLTLRPNFRNKPIRHREDFLQLASRHPPRRSSAGWADPIWPRSTQACAARAITSDGRATCRSSSPRPPSWSCRRAAIIVPSSLTPPPGRTVVATIQTMAAEQLGLDLTAAQDSGRHPGYDLVTLTIVLFAWPRRLRLGHSQALSENIAFDLRNDLFGKIQHSASAPRQKSHRPADPRYRRRRAAARLHRPGPAACKPSSCWAVR
jgi:DNA-binding MarR family transcriptional regulator